MEDHPDTGRLLANLLGSRGHIVSLATSCASARVLAKESRFDLFVCDLGLPDGSGLDLMREFKSGFALHGVALTGYGTEQDRKRAMDAGFSEFLVKPIDFGQLEEAVRRMASIVLSSEPSV